MDKSSWDCCWDWLGSIDSNGYGAFKRDGKKQNAHRVAYEISNGPITTGMDVMHSCDNRACCNPVHLLLGTRKRNVADAKTKGRLAIGSRHGQSVLTEPLVRAIKMLVAETGLPASRLAKQLDLNERTVQMAISGQTWSHLVYGGKDFVP